MNVKLIKLEEVEFTLAEDKCEKLSHSTFRMLTGYQEGETPESNSPKMVAFKTKDEYQREAYKYNLDLDKEVLINQKGNIFCYVKEGVVPANEEAENVPADTK